MNHLRFRGNNATQIDCMCELCISVVCILALLGSREL